MNSSEESRLVLVLMLLLGILLIESLKFLYLMANLQ